MPASHTVRETHRFLQVLTQDRRALKRATDLSALAASLLGDNFTNPWIAFLRRMLDAWKAESNDSGVPVQEALEFWMRLAPKVGENLHTAKGWC